MQRRKLTGQQCQCTGCGEAFRRVGSFDMHRTGKGVDRRCLTPAQMLELGLSLDDKGFWRQLGNPYRVYPRKPGWEEREKQHAPS